MAPPPEYDKEPKAPDKSASNICCEETKALHNLLNDQQNNTDCKIANANVTANADVEDDSERWETDRYLLSILEMCHDTIDWIDRAQIAVEAEQRKSQLELGGCNTDTESQSDGADLDAVSELPGAVSGCVADLAEGNRTLPDDILYSYYQTDTDAASISHENNKHIETLDDGQLKALLDEAITYKCPKDREGKSSLFKELLEEVEQDEQACEAAARNLNVGRRQRGGRGGGARHSVAQSNSLQDLVAALAAEPAPRRHHRHHNAPPATSVSARTYHGGSLPSGVDTSFLLGEEASSSRGGASYLATVRCVNPPPLSERRVSASDAPQDDSTRRPKPASPMTYTARATLEIGSGGVSGRATTTTTASNQVRTRALTHASTPSIHHYQPTRSTARIPQRYLTKKSILRQQLTHLAREQPLSSGLYRKPMPTVAEIEESMVRQPSSPPNHLLSNSSKEQLTGQDLMKKQLLEISSVLKWRPVQPKTEKKPVAEVKTTQHPVFSKHPILNLLTRFDHQRPHTTSFGPPDRLCQKRLYDWHNPNQDYPKRHHIDDNQQYNKNILRGSDLQSSIISEEESHNDMTIESVDTAVERVQASTVSTSTGIVEEKQDNEEEKHNPQSQLLRALISSSTCDSDGAARETKAFNKNNVTLSKKDLVDVKVRHPMSGCPANTTSTGQPSNYDEFLPLNSMSPSKNYKLQVKKTETKSSNVINNKKMKPEEAKQTFKMLVNDDEATVVAKALDKNAVKCDKTIIIENDQFRKANLTHNIVVKENATLNILKPADGESKRNIDFSTNEKSMPQISHKNRVKFNKKLITEKYLPGDAKRTPEKVAIENKTNRMVKIAEGGNKLNGNVINDSIKPGEANKISNIMPNENKTKCIAKALNEGDKWNSIIINKTTQLGEANQFLKSTVTVNKRKSSAANENNKRKHVINDHTDQNDELMDWTDNVNKWYEGLKVPKLNVPLDSRKNNFIYGVQTESSQYISNTSCKTMPKVYPHSVNPIRNWSEQFKNFYSNKKNEIVKVPTTNNISEVAHKRVKSQYFHDNSAPHCRNEIYMTWYSRDSNSHDSRATRDNDLLQSKKQSNPHRKCLMKYDSSTRNPRNIRSMSIGKPLSGFDDFDVVSLNNSVKDTAHSNDVSHVIENINVQECTDCQLFIFEDQSTTSDKQLINYFDKKASEKLTFNTTVRLSTQINGKIKQSVNNVEDNKIFDSPDAPHYPIKSEAAIDITKAIKQDVCNEISDKKSSDENVVCCKIPTNIEIENPTVITGDQPISKLHEPSEEVLQVLTLKGLADEGNLTGIQINAEETDSNDKIGHTTFLGVKKGKCDSDDYGDEPSLDSSSSCFENVMSQVTEYVKKSLKDKNNVDSVFLSDKVRNSNVNETAENKNVYNESITGDNLLQEKLEINQEVASVDDDVISDKDIPLQKQIGITDANPNVVCVNKIEDVVITDKDNFLKEKSETVEVVQVSNECDNEMENVVISNKDSLMHEKSDFAGKEIVHIESPAFPSVNWIENILTNVEDDWLQVISGIVKEIVEVANSNDHEDVVSDDLLQEKLKRVGVANTNECVSEINDALSAENNLLQEKVEIVEVASTKECVSEIEDVAIRAQDNLLQKNNEIIVVANKTQCMSDMENVAISDEENTLQKEIEIVKIASTKKCVNNIKNIISDKVNLMREKIEIVEHDILKVTNSSVECVIEVEDELSDEDYLLQEKLDIIQEEEELVEFAKPIIGYGKAIEDCINSNNCVPRGEKTNKETCRNDPNNLKTSNVILRNSVSEEQSTSYPDDDANIVFDRPRPLISVDSSMLELKNSISKHAVENIRSRPKKNTKLDSSKKETIDKTAQRNVIFMKDSAEAESSDMLPEVDSAIPFSCITTPEVVASCNTTPSTAQSSVAVDPKPRSVITSSFNGLPLARPSYGSMATADDYKKSLDENGNALHGFSTPLGASSQHKKPRRKKSSKNETVIKSHQIDGYQGNKDLNEVLRFIESNADAPRSNGPKLRKARHDDEDKPKKRERRKDKQPPQRAASLEEVAVSSLRELTTNRPPPAKPERRSWGDEFRQEEEPGEFQTVTKKRRWRRRDAPAPLPPAPRPRRVSAPPSDRSDSNDDGDSVHSLHSLPALNAADGGRAPASYADIARAANIPDLIESCNFYAEEAVTVSVGCVSSLPPAAEYPALEPRRRPHTAKPAPPAPATKTNRKERAESISSTTEQATVTAERTSERSHEWPTERSKPRSSERSIERSTDRSKELSTERSKLRSKEQSVERSQPAPDVVRRPAVILLDSTRHNDIQGITFGFDINEQLLTDGSRRPRCDLVADAVALPPAPPPPPAPTKAVALTPPPPPPAVRYLPPPTPTAPQLAQIVNYVGSAWEDVVRCSGGKVRYFSE